MQQKEDIAGSCCWSFHEKPQWYLRMCLYLTYLAALLGAKLLSTIALTDIFLQTGYTPDAVVGVACTNDRSSSPKPPTETPEMHFCSLACCQ